MIYDDRKKFQELLKALAIITNKDITRTIYEVYWAGLKDLSIEQVEQAVFNYLSGVQPFFPTIGQLRQQLQVSEESEVRIVEAKIREGICRIGYYDHQNKAKEFIGDLAWQVVQLCGGWQEVCKTENIEMASPKWREIARSLIERNRLGIENQLPRLSNYKKSTPQLENFSNTVEKVITQNIL